MSRAPEDACAWWLSALCSIIPPSSFVVLRPSPWSVHATSPPPISTPAALVSLLLQFTCSFRWIVPFSPFLHDYQSFHSRYALRAARHSICAGGRGLPQPATERTNPPNSTEVIACSPACRTWATGRFAFQEPSCLFIRCNLPRSCLFSPFAS